MAHAIFHLLAAQVWCALLAFAFFGWGSLVLRFLAGSVSSIGLAGCLGVAVVLALGGVLDILHLVTAPALIGCAVAGLLLGLGQIAAPASSSGYLELAALREAWGGRWNGPRILLVVFFILLALRMGATTRVVSYASADDDLFYLAEPVKMLDLHQVSVDPYSERRVLTSVGGNYFLQGLVLSALPLQNVQMADQDIGVILLVLVALALTRLYELSPAEALVFALFAVLIPAEDRNLTFATLPSALFLAFVLVGADGGAIRQRPLGQAIFFGMLGASLCAIKSIYLPHAALFCGGIYLLWAWRRGLAFSLRGWTGAGVGALLVLTPWMIPNRAGTGTFFYPILGHGYHFSSYHEWPLSSTTDLFYLLSQGAVYFVPLAAILAVQLWLWRSDDRSVVLLALTAACLTGALALGFSTGGEAVRRYNAAIVMPTLLTTFLLFSWEKHRRPGWMPAFLLQGLSVLMLVLASAVVGFGPQGAEYVALWERFKTSLTDQPLDSDGTIKEYAAISSAIPHDAGALLTLQHSYLLDPFTSGMYFADWPGCASPAPGWPIHADGEALASFLLSHSVRYLAYSYKDDMLLTVVRSGHAVSEWVAVEGKSYLLAHQQYMELEKSRRKIYDDGTVFILDLGTPSS
jgi:hypothetical protein